MYHVVELRCAPRLPHVAVLALISIGFAGCSADMSTRLSQDPFSNPFASQPEATASVHAPVERRELPQYVRPQSLGQSSAPANAAPQSYPTASASSSGGERGVTSHASLGQPIVAANHGSGHGGTTIIVGTSDTLDTLSRHYNVSPAAILGVVGSAEARDRVQKDHHVAAVLDQPLGFLDHHLGDLDVTHRRLVEGRGHYLALHRALHVRDFLGALVDQEAGQRLQGTARRAGVSFVFCRSILS